MVDKEYKKLFVNKPSGQIITFYSYKGGVGRSLALANIAALLAKWGKRVLIIDWDLEAPGLENFYTKFINFDTVSQKKGLIDLLMLNNDKSKVLADEIQWSDYIIHLHDQLLNLYIITSGKKDEDYGSKIRALNVSKFFEDDGGKFLENLRNYWLNDFDFVFIDSRTGLTDNSGVSSIHMPDVLVLLFTLNEQSLKGSLEVANKAAKTHLKIVYDRLKLKILAIPTRIENNESVRREEWLQRISDDLVPYFDWLPREKNDLKLYSLSPKELINQIKIPYLPEYAYGEQLPAIEKGTNDPQDIGFVYETIAAIFANNFNKIDLLKDSRDKFIKIAKGEIRDEISEENLHEWLQYIPRPKVLNANERWNVFLSYTPSDRNWVLSLYDILTELGYKVFLDLFKMMPGDDLLQKNSQALEESQAGILIWSGRTGNSARVTNEYEHLEAKASYEKSFIFIPVIIGESKFPSFENEITKLPTFLTNRIVIDFTAYPDGPNGGDLLRLLYGISGIPISADAIKFANELDEITPTAFAQVNAAIRNARPQRLLQLFEEGGLPWKITPTLGCKTAEGLIKLKETDKAIAMLERLEMMFKKALRPKQLKGLAFARRGNEGDLDNAHDILGELYAKNDLDPETMGIYARTWMDKYALSGKEIYLIQSRNLYAEAFEKAPDDYYTGINAAAKSVLLGTPEDLERAKGYAELVQKITGTDPIQAITGKPPL